MINSSVIIKLLAVYSVLAVSFVSYVIFFNFTDVHAQAVLKMGLGLIFFWIVIGGFLTLKFRDKIKEIVQGINFGWKTKFILFCTLLALLEEAITTSMTNLAPFFGSEIGKAFITASANYFHVVLFHSAIVFIPMFVAWAYLLSRYDFNPNQVFLLFGLLGSIAEAGINPSSFFGGFWFFVYGLMIYLPAYSIPKDRGTVKPKLKHYVLAIVLPFLCALPVALIVSAIRSALGVPFFID